MSSVSADTPKPTLLVCVHHLSPSAQAIIDNGCFVVNVLRDDQSYISDTFAGRFKDQFEDKFDCTEWVGTSTGALRVADPLVAFDCRVVSAELVGTHYVFFGEVEEIFNSGRGSLLIYANRAYGAASRIDGVKSVDSGQKDELQSLSLGCFHSFGPYLVPQFMRILADEPEPIVLRPVEGDQRRIIESLQTGECEVGLLYDHKLPDRLRHETLARLDLYVLLAENDPLRDKLRIGPEDLVDNPMIFLDGPPTDKFLAHFKQVTGKDPFVSHRPTSLEMARSMVGHGLGYTVLATKPASSMTYDGQSLVQRPFSGTGITADIVLATKDGKTLSRAAEKFLLFCRSYFENDD